MSQPRKRILKIQVFANEEGETPRTTIEATIFDDAEGRRLLTSLAGLINPDTPPRKRGCLGPAMCEPQKPIVEIHDLGAAIEDCFDSDPTGRRLHANLSNQITTERQRYYLAKAQGAAATGEGTSD